MATSSTRNMTSKTVGPKQASSYRKAQDAKGRVQANADKVAEITGRDQAADKEAAITTWLAFAERQGGSVKARGIAAEQGRKLAAWGKSKAGRKPNTKALDLLNAAYAAGWTHDRERNMEKGTRKGRSLKYASPEYAQAIANKKAAKAGVFTRKGKRLSDDEARSYIAAVQEAHPKWSAKEAQEVSWWVDCNAVSFSRFLPLWNEVAASRKAAARQAVA